MGLELVRKAQALKFQGGKAPSTLVPMFVLGMNGRYNAARCAGKTLLTALGS